MLEPVVSDHRNYATSDGEPIIHIHEDEWAMRNIFPLTVQEEVAAELDALSAASEKNRDPSGFGWNDIYAIQSPSSSYVETGLRIADAAAVLAPIMPRVRHFYATVGVMIGRAERDPLGSYEDDAWCFGLGSHCYLKLEVEADLVRRIWFDIESNNAKDMAALRRSMEAIDALMPSFVGDYVADAKVLISDATLLDQYFSRLDARIADDENWLREQSEKRQQP